jgi:ankyrin repeat protein
MPLEFEPIFNKALTGGYKEVGEIIDAGAPINATDENGNTALHAACPGGSLKTVKAVLRRGCETNAQNRHGNTPLHYAYAFGHQDVAEYLVRKGNASQEVRNIYGHFACEGLGQEEKERPGY